MITQVMKKIIFLQTYFSSNLPKHRINSHKHNSPTENSEVEVAGDVRVDSTIIQLHFMKKFHLEIKIDGSK